MDGCKLPVEPPVAISRTPSVAQHSTNTAASPAWLARASAALSVEASDPANRSAALTAGHSSCRSPPLAQSTCAAPLPTARILRTGAGSSQGLASHMLCAASPAKGCHCRLVSGQERPRHRAPAAQSAGSQTGKVRARSSDISDVSDHTTSDQIQSDRSRSIRQYSRGAGQGSGPGQATPYQWQHQPDHCRSHLVILIPVFA